MSTRPLILVIFALSLGACAREPRIPDGPKLYVSNEVAGTVSVIDVHSRRVVRTIPVGKRPRGIRASRDGRTIYVALSGSPIGGPNVDESTLPPPDRRHDGIGVIDVATGKLDRILPGGTDPEQFILSKDERMMFIANEDAAQVSVLDVASGRIVRTIAVGGEPEGVDLSPDGGVVYVTSEEENQVFAIDTGRLEAVATIDVGARPRSTGFVPTAPIAYVSAENDAAVYVIATTTHSVLKRIPLEGPNVKPMGVIVSPDGDSAYVTTGRGGSLVKIDTRTHAAQGALAVGERPWGVDVSADGRWIFTANGPSNDVTIVDAHAWTIAAKVAAGERPWGVVFVP